MRSNTIWGVAATARPRSWWWTLWGWGRAMLLVLAFGGLLVVSLVLTTILSSIATYAPTAIDGIVPRAELINTAVSAIVMFLLFAMIFKWLPDVKIVWSDVWAGAVVTTVLFLLGKEVLATYLTHVGAAVGVRRRQFAGLAAFVGLLLIADSAGGRRVGARLCRRSRLARRNEDAGRSGPRHTGSRAAKRLGTAAGRSARAMRWNRRDTKTVGSADRTNDRRRR